jgi:hypothetical protein
MTQDEHKEWLYRYYERLGILIDGVRRPTPEEDAIARREADLAVKNLVANENEM